MTLRAARAARTSRTAGALALLAALLAVRCGPALPDGPEVVVDRHGFFVSTQPVARPWHAGAGVLLLVPHQKDDVVHGRLDTGADDVTLLGHRGFAPHRPLMRASSRGLGEEVRTALAGALANRPGVLAPVLVEALEDARGTALPAPEHAVALERAALPPPSGAPLAAWAPRSLPFVWLRSVEAGYRLASVIDDVVGHVLAARGDGRDAATLRLTLHDLLLPTIWRANPSGEKGVGECGVVLGPALHRGRLRVAVIFRIVDPELHRMETQAGIALESRPEHLWQPTDDPFPARRARRNARRRVADVEIVATDARLADALAGGVVQAHAHDADTLAFLSGPGVGPGRRALAAVFPSGTVVQSEALVAEHVSAAAESLLHPHWPDAAPPARATRESPLRLRRAEVRTDVEGAFVRLETAAEESARRWEAALLAPAPQGGGPGAGACAANRADLAALVLLDGVREDPIERSLVVLGTRPVCPSHGAYRVHPITRAVTCGAHGARGRTGVSPEASAWPVTKVTRTATDVTLRVAIDWRRRE